MINAIIIDDEPAARASLALEINLHCPQITVVAEASSVEEGMETVLNHPHGSLLFLDIQLSDGSGFDLLQKINFEHLKIIFTNAYIQIRALLLFCSPQSVSKIKVYQAKNLFFRHIPDITNFRINPKRSTPAAKKTVPTSSELRSEPARSSGNPRDTA